MGASRLEDRLDKKSKRSKTMTARRKITKVAAGLLAIMMALSFVGRAGASTAKYLYDFQKTTDPWTAGVDCHPEFTDPCDTNGVLQVRSDKKYGVYAGLYNKGANAVWMQNEFFSVGNTLSVQFDAFPVDNSDRL